MYRSVFRRFAVSYPADMLRLQDQAGWIRHHGLVVDAADAIDLGLAVSAGVMPVRVIMHSSDSAEAALLDAVSAGAGRFVVDSVRQVDLLAANGPYRRRVLISTDSSDFESVVDAVVGAIHLDLIGIHRRLPSGADGPAAVRSMIARMKGITRSHPVLPARLSLGAVDLADWDCAPTDIPAIAAAVEQAVEDGCIASKFPTPAVNVSPSPEALTVC